MECQSQKTDTVTSLSEKDDGCVNSIVEGHETKSCDPDEININGHDANHDAENEFRSNKEVDGASSDESGKNDVTYETNEICPCVGMKFDSHEDAYAFYNRYAGHVGFSIRKYSTAKSQRTMEVIFRRYSCSLEGFRDARCKHFEERKRNRSNLRTGCMAKMAIRKKGDKWIVSQVVEEHNHELATPNERHKLRSLRKITKVQEQEFVNMCLAGAQANLMVSYMATESGGSCNIGFNEKDARNLLSTKRQKRLVKGDTQAVLDYFQRQQIENPSFFYSVQLDSEGQITNFFWADARSRMDYYHFGDIICFDPTYGTNKCGIPFVPILGINHHNQIVLFGGALLYDKSEESFVWVMKTWIQAMNGKQSKVIVTDQETSIEGAIKLALPGTHHRYCLSHINRDAMKTLPHDIVTNKSFPHDLTNCLYGCETVEEFESSWEDMLKRYDLEQNSWLLELFEKRGKWAPLYTRDIFFEPMYTAQRTESINVYFDGYLKKFMTLSEFFNQYEKAVINRREAEKDEDFETNQKTRVLRFSMDIEKQAANVYTRAIFQKFQDELFEGLSFRHKKIEEVGSNSIYHVWRVGHEHMKCTVSFNHSDTSVKCSCQLFEFAGYLCRHILKVFIAVDVHNIPVHYILKRWTKDAKCGSVVDDQGEQMQSDLNETFTVRYSKLCQEAINIASKGATSTESYRVAMDAFRNALKEVEAVVQNPSSCHISQNKRGENEHNGKVREGSSKHDSNNKGPLLDLPIVRHNDSPRPIEVIDKLPKSKKSTVQRIHKKNLPSVSRENSVATSNTMPQVTEPTNRRIGVNLSSSIAVTNNISDSSQLEGCDFVDLVRSAGQQLYCSSSSSGLGFGTMTQVSYLNNPSLDVQPNHQAYHLNQGSSLVGQHTVPSFISHNFYQQRHSGNVGILQSGQENTLANVLTTHRQEGNTIDLNDSNQIDSRFGAWS